MSVTETVSRLKATGRKLLQNSRSTTAIKVLQQALEMSPKDGEIAYMLGMAALTNGNKPLAVESFRIAALASRNDVTALFDLSRPLVSADDPLSGWEVIEQAEKTNPSDLFEQLAHSRTHEIVLVGERLTNAGREDLSLKAFQMAARLHPSRFDVLHKLWTHELRLGLLDEARATLRSAPVFDSPDEAAATARYRLLCDWMQETLDGMGERAARFDAAATGGKPRLVYALALWGDHYVAAGARQLRTLAAPGNMPALAEAFDLCLGLVTTPKDFEALKATGAIDLLSDCMTVEPIFMPPELVVADEHHQPTELMYYIYNMSLHLCIDLAKAARAGVSPLAADHFFSDGSWRHIGELAKQGYEAVCTAAPLCSRETFLPAFDTACPQDGPIVLSSRELMALCEDHLHAIIKRSTVSPSNPDFNCPPGLLFWMDGHDLVAHGFCVHPMFISADRVAQYHPYRFTTVDGHLVGNMFPDPKDWEKVHVIGDSDKFAQVGLNTDHQTIMTTGRPFTIDTGRQYLKDRSMIRDFNEWIFQWPMRFKGLYKKTKPNEYNPNTPKEILKGGYRFASEKEALFP